MFFFLSKILLFLIYPFTWIIFFLLYAIITRKPKLKKLFLIVASLLLLLFSNSLLFNYFASRWENVGLSKDSLKPCYKYGIVLSGMMEYNYKINDAEFSLSADRLFKAIELYKAGKIEKIILSGGSGNVMNQDFKEAAYLKDYLIKIDIPEEDILLEENSRNTHENAKFSIEKFRLDTLGADFCLLITSALHMRRASGCFKKAGLQNFDCFSTDYTSFKINSKLYLPNLIIPTSTVLSKWNFLIKEWVGYLSYKIARYLN